MTGKKKKRKRPKWASGPVRGVKPDLVAVDEAQHMAPQPEVQQPSKPRGPLPVEVIDRRLRQFSSDQLFRLMHLFRSPWPPHKDWKLQAGIIKCMHCGSTIQIYLNGTQIICPMCKDFLFGVDVICDENREWFKTFMERWKDGLPKIQVKDCKVGFKGVEVGA